MPSSANGADSDSSATARAMGSSGPPGAAGKGASPVRLEGVTPILRVRSLEASTDHYVAVLGFGVDWQVSGFASVSRDGCGIMLCEGDQGFPGTWLWIGVTDVEPLFEELRARGAKVRHPPTNHPWAYEMQIEDPDGHVLRFGSEPKADQPRGPWLDMRGDLWTTLPDGRQKRVERG